MPVPTGNITLDRMLDGGLPENRTILVTGGPGTGKSTLAMQFLQEGLQRGEDCLFISTEQTLDELEDSFNDFVFDLDDEHLTITTLHATPGYTVDVGDKAELTLETLEGGQMLGGEYSAPFEPRYIMQYLERFTPADRVVLDSVSGLSSVGSDQDVFRRTVLDLIRLINDDFGATAIFTAEESQPDVTGDVEIVAASDAIQFNTHGVLRLWREQVAGEDHRFVEIVKMRGVDHDSRSYEFHFGETGIRITPRNRTHPIEFVPDAYLETDIEGFDDLLGGGIVKGGTMVLLHDGQAAPHSILTNMLVRAREEDMAVTLVPPVELPPKRLERIIDERIDDMDDLMTNDELFLVDFTNIWENTRRNVFKPANHEDEHPPDVFRTIDERRGDQAMFSAINVEAQLPLLDGDELRQVRFWEEEHLYLEGDTSVYLYNPGTLSDQLAAFYENGAWQTVRTWVGDNGLQYVKLEKSPSGYLGSTRLVEYVEEEPYMRIQQPSGGGQ